MFLGGVIFGHGGEEWNSDAVYSARLIRGQSSRTPFSSGSKSPTIDRMKAWLAEAEFYFAVGLLATYARALDLSRLLQLRVAGRAVYRLA